MYQLDSDPFYQTTVCINRASVSTMVRSVSSTLWSVSTVLLFQLWSGLYQALCGLYQPCFCFNHGPVCIKQSVVCINRASVSTMVRSVSSILWSVSNTLILLKKNTLWRIQANQFLTWPTIFWFASTIYSWLFQPSFSQESSSPGLYQKSTYLYQRLWTPLWSVSTTFFLSVQPVIVCMLFLHLYLPVFSLYEPSIVLWQSSSGLYQPVFNI